MSLSGCCTWVLSNQATWAKCCSWMSLLLAVGVAAVGVGVGFGVVAARCNKILKHVIAAVTQRSSSSYKK